MDWIDVNDRLPTHIYSVVVWVTGGPRHFAEDYIDIGVYNAKRGKWQAGATVDGKADDIDIEVSHWFMVTAPPGKELV